MPARKKPTSGPSLNPAENMVRSLPQRSRQDGGGKPRAPFASNYDLTREQEDSAMALCDAWERTLKDSSGWNETDPKTFLYDGAGADPLMIGGYHARPHFVKRALYSAMAENEYQWRKWLYPGGIYEKSNISAPLARRVSRAMAAKAIEFFFGSKPYFFCSAVGPSDKSMAEAIQKVAEDRLDSSKSTAALRDAIQTAFDLGESVMKVSHRRRQDLYRKKERVLVTYDGVPVMAKNGDYITSDAFVTDDDGNKTHVDGTPIPMGAKFAMGNWARVATHYAGPDVSEIDHRCILAPLDAKSLDEAECVLHMYEITATDLAAMFTDSRTGAQIMQAVDLLQGIAGEPRVSAEDPSAPATTAKSGKVKVQEFWIRMDADQDGMAEDVCFVRVDTGDGWRPLFYDYAANITATKQRPFVVIRPIRKRGSWTGIGAMELFEKHQEVVDLMLNRWSFATSTSGHITVFDPEAFEETAGLEAADIDLNNGKYLRLKPGIPIDRAPIKRIYLEDNIGPAWQQIMQFFLQMAMNESGVQHANDGGIAGLHTTELATGINDVRKAGDQLFGVFVACLEDGVSSTVDKFVHTLFAKIEGSIVARITEDQTVTKEWEVKRDDVAGLSFDVRITLARYHTAHMLESVNAVLGPCTQYYSLPPAVQARLTPLLHQMLKAVQINDPQSIISPLLPVPIEEIAESAAFAMSLPPEMSQKIMPLVLFAQTIPELSQPSQLAA